jgi:diamine N-acetyltransferase
MTINIRPAQPNDATLLAELGYHTEDDMQLYLKKAYSIEAIEANLNNPNIAYFIATEEAQAIGYTKLLLHVEHTKLSGEVIELEKIYVKKTYLDKKVGKALMDHAINYAKRNKYNTLFLGVWQENTRAVSFYHKFNFEVFDTRSFQLGQTICDDFMMKIEL